ncbi:MAG: hypothetical protein IT577_20630 [Verrucomicrobiae bacterium]|nr:hypothetical protein [Verrucomicrobiae bacterium]
MDGDYEYLLKLCRAGKLYEAEVLLAEGVDPNPPPNLRKSALAVAIEKGFHSLVVLLLRSGARPGQRDMWEVARSGNVELLGLLIDHGGLLLEPRDVAAACERGGGPAIDLLASRGVDLVKGAPLFEALCTGNKSVIGAWKRHLDRDPRLAAQGAMALAVFCREGSARGVALMLWAGADPRMPIPSEGKIEEEDPDRRTTALVEAAAGGKVAILKALRIDPLTDDLPDLMCAADLHDRRDAVEFLLDLCTAIQRAEALWRMLQSAIWSLEWKSDPRSGWWGQYPASFEVEKIERLARMGARLSLDREPALLLRVRAALRRAEPDLALRVIRALASGPVPDTEELRWLVRTKAIVDKMRYQNLSRGDMELLGMKLPKEATPAAHRRVTRRCHSSRH